MSVTRLDETTYTYQDYTTGKIIYFSKDEELIIRQRVGNSKVYEIFRAPVSEIEDFVRKFHEFRLFHKDTKYLFLSKRRDKNGHIMPDELIYRAKGHLSDRPISHSNRFKLGPKRKGKKSSTKVVFYVQSLPNLIAEEIEQSKSIGLPISEERFNSFIVRYLLAYFAGHATEDRIKMITKGRKFYDDMTRYSEVKGSETIKNEITELL
jgi:hypothetical protein